MGGADENCWKLGVVGRHGQVTSKPVSGLSGPIVMPGNGVGRDAREWRNGVGHDAREWRNGV